MNGEIPIVPITTLAGIASLTDLLPELPLPTPLSNAVTNKSLLYSLKLTDKSKRLLENADDALVEQLSNVLCTTSTEHIELKDSLAGDLVDGEMPELLSAILANDPDVFKTSRSNRAGRTPGTSPHNSQSPYHQPHSPRVSHPSVNSVQKSPSLPHHPQPGSSNLNGDHTDRRSKSHRTPGPIMNSPAQATVAETVLRQSVPHHSRGAHASTSEAIVLDDEDEDVAPRRGTRSHRDSDKQKSSDQKLQDSWAEKMRAIGKPVVMLEMLDPKCGLGDRSKKDDPWNSKCRPLSVALEPLDERTLKSIATGGTVKTDMGRRGKKRRDDYDSYDRSKRRKRHGDRDEESESDDSDYDHAQELLRKKKKEKRQRRMNQADLSIEELLESPTFKRFSTALERIFDSAEEHNFGSLDPNDEEVECPPDSLISRSILHELTSETAKLRSMGVLNQVPASTLVKLLTILQWNIRDGTKLLPFMEQDHDEEEDEEGQKLWREIAMERVGRSMDAALTAIYIMTSPKMPKHVFLEDVIDRIVLFGKFQLTNTIYPEFDPVYRILSKEKDGYHGSLKLKRARAGQVKHKSTVTLYNKLTDLVGNLADLVEIQELTDTLILQISGLGVAPFFVENVSELQLNSMKLVTTVFAHYDKHRQLILEDIFSSLARLPSSKRNLRSYRLNADEHIQMVTALALQLIQCVVKLPPPPDSALATMTEEEQQAAAEEKARKEKSSPRGGKRKSDGPMDPDVVIVSSYETAMRTGYNFLSVFLKKCTMKGEDDYRPLFENFVQDLLSTVNKPEWPSSELLLSLLGKILVKQFSNKSTEMPLRTAALEYLGIVAARLRKDAVSSQLNQEVIDDIVTKVNEEEEGDEDEQKNAKRSTRRHKEDSPEPVAEKPDETECLQKAMLDYLAYNGISEPAYVFARQFYIAQWFRDTTKEAEKKQRKSLDESEFEPEEEEKNTEHIGDIEARTKFLFSQVHICSTATNAAAASKPSPSKLDYDMGCLVARYLSSKRPFAQSFDIYLGQILKVLAENAVAIRTKAMKCLTSVVEADPGVLARPDMERGVHGRFLDPSTSVREAAIELVGKFILIRPDIIPQYYNMLSERILDTGISVRKRVIKIFRDIFSVQPDFNKIPDMCVKMIRRVNDEDGIKKLVNEVFQTMWFTPLSAREKDSAKLIQRVVNITEVVAASRETGYEFIEQLLDNLLKKDEHGNHNKSALTSCRQIVDCLVENVLRLEEGSVDGKNCSVRQSACLSTMYLFSRIKPDLMVGHATTLQPYLNIKCNGPSDNYVLHYVARILEMVIPLMDHPNENFLAQVEEDTIKLILNHGMLVLESCVSCLGAVVNNVSHNYPLVKDCFQKFFGYLEKVMSYQTENPTVPLKPNRKPTLLRSLFTVGLMCKHFNFDSKAMTEGGESLKEKIFDVLVFFTHHEDEDVRVKALTGLGFLAVRHYEYMLGRTITKMYADLLSRDGDTSVKLKCQVLKNLYIYLIEEEVRMAKSDAEWKKHSKEEDLKEMGDVQSGMASTIMQVYLKQVLESFFNSKSQVRLEALNVIQLVLKQGLIHPVQCVPYLISMCTDTEAAIRIKAEQQLQEIEKKDPGFIQMKALHGIKMCFRLQEIIQSEDHHCIIRGLRNPDSNSASLNAFLYSILRTNRSHRRAILTTLLNLCDDSARISLPEQLYIVDNLAFFLYQTQDEPLFIIHQIDIIVSVSGSNLLQSFRERLEGGESRAQKTKKEQNLKPEKPRRVTRSKALANQGGVTENGISENTPHHHYIDDDDEDKGTLMGRLPADMQPLKEIILIAQGCILLLYLKQHLKDLYGFTDSKIQNYSPTEPAKVTDKPIQRKTLVKFNPECVLHVLNARLEDEQMEWQEEREKLVNDFLSFKDLMLSVDPPDEDDSDDGGANKASGEAGTHNTPVTYSIKQRSGGEPGAGGDAAAGTTNHVGEEGGGAGMNHVGHGEAMDGDSNMENNCNAVDKESPSEPVKPRIPTVIISTAKLQQQTTPNRDKEKKRGSLVRTFRLPGASQLQDTAHNSTSPVHSHSSHHSSHHSSRSHGSHHKSHHHRSDRSDRSDHHSSSSSKKKKKRRRRFGSDDDEDDDDSDYAPC